MNDSVKLSAHGLPSDDGSKFRESFEHAFSVPLPSELLTDQYLFVGTADRHLFGHDCLDLKEGEEIELPAVGIRMLEVARKPPGQRGPGKIAVTARAPVRGYQV